MSSIDERIVDMQFNNGQFEKGIKTSLDSLGQLDKGLNLSKIKDSLAGLSSVANGVKLDGLMSAVDNASSRFEGLRAVATGALLSIGDRVVDLAQNTISNMTRAARDGFGEYETQMNAIQTILANTDSKGTTMTEVTDALELLNTYADMTIYNFSEMTRNIGTFTAAGVDLQTSVDAIKGIANLAAVSGSNSQQASTAMYQLSQALSTGTVKLMDWNSVVNAGMGGEVFQNALKETARVHGVAVDDIIADQGSFRDSLSEGWLTSSILLDTLKKFTGDLSREQILSMGYTEAQADEILRLGVTASDAATKVKTFSQLMGTLAEAQGSGWAKSWQIIIGDFEEAKLLFTEVSDRIGALIGESADARNAQLQIWKDAGGREAIIQALRNAFDALMKIVNALKSAWEQVFPPSLGKTLTTISFMLRDFTAGLIISDDAAANLQAGAKGLFYILKFGFDIIVGVVRVLWNFFLITKTLTGAIFSFITPLLTFIRSFIPLSSNADGAAWSISSLFDIVVGFEKFINSKLIAAIADGAAAFDNWLKSGGPRKAILNIIDALIAFGKAMHDVYSILFRGDFTGNPLFQEDSTMTKVLFAIREGAIAAAKAIAAFFGSIGKNFGNVSKILKDGLGDGFAKVDWNVVLASLSAGLLATVVVGLMNFIRSVKNVFQSFGDILEELGNTLKAFQMKLKAEALKEIAIAIGILALALLVLSTIDPDRLLTAVIAMGTAFGLLLAGMGVLSKILNSTLSLKDYAKMILLGAAMQILAQGILLLAVAVRILGGMSWESLAKGIGGIAVLLTGLLIAAKQLSKGSKDLGLAALGIMAMATAINWLIVPVLALAFIPLDKLATGIGAVALMLGVLVAFALVFDKVKTGFAAAAVGLLSMAGALNLLVVPIIALGMLPIGVLVQGMNAMGIALLALVAVALLFSTLDKQIALASIGLIAMALALNLLVAPLLALGLMDGDKLAQGLTAMAIALGILIVAGLALGFAGPVVLIGAAALIFLAAAMLVMSIAIVAMAAIPMDFLMQGLLNMATALGVLALTATLLLPFIPILLLFTVAMVGMGLGMLAIAGGMAIFVIALVALTPALIAASVGLLGFAVIAPTLLDMVPTLLALGGGLIVFGAGALVAGVGIAALGVALVIMGAGMFALGLFGAVGASGLTVFANAVIALFDQGWQLLAVSAILLVLGAAVLVLGAGVTLLAVGLLIFAGAMALFAAVGVMGGVVLGMVLLALLKFVDSLPGIILLAAGLTLLGIAIGAIGVGLLILGVAALVAAGGLAVLGATAPLIIAAFRAIALGLSMVGPQLGVLAIFSVALIALGIGLVAFGAGSAVAAIGVLLLGAAMIVLAMGLSLLVKALTTFAVVGAKGTEALLKFYQSLDGMIWQVPALLAIGAAFAVLGGGLLVLGAGLMLVGIGALLAMAGLALLGSIGSIVQASLAKMSAAVLAFIPVGVAMGGLAVFVLSLATAFGVLAVAVLLASVALGLAGGNLNGIANSAQAVVLMMRLMMNSIGFGLPKFQSDLTASSDALKAFVVLTLLTLLKLEAGMSDSKPKLVTASKMLVTSVLMALTMGLAGGGNAIYSAGYDVGDNMIAGMKRGLQNGSDSLNYVARLVALNALQASKDALGIHSPSTEYWDVGTFSILGLANSMLKNSSISDKAATQVGESSIAALKKSLSGIGAAIDSNVDMSPTITPVLDLSAVKRDAALIGSALSTDAIRVDSAFRQAAIISSENDGDGPNGSNGSEGNSGDTINYTQNNNSPKALSTAEIYRNTKNQMSKTKEELAKK